MQVETSVPSGVGECEMRRPLGLKDIEYVLRRRSGELGGDWSWVGKSILNPQYIFSILYLSVLSGSLVYSLFEYYMNIFYFSMFTLTMLFWGITYLIVLYYKAVYSYM